MGTRAFIVVLSLAILPGCKTETHLLYRVSTDYVESGRQWVWPYFLDRKPTVVAFWNTDVAECLRDIPALTALDHRDTAQLVTVVTGLDREDVDHWLTRDRVRFVVLLDLEEEFAKKLDVTGYPTFLLFDTDGDEIARSYSIRTVANWFDKPRWLERSGAVDPDPRQAPSGPVPGAENEEE